MDFELRGRKHICSTCGTKFFDLNKDKAICPNCGKEQINQEISSNFEKSKVKQTKSVSAEDKLEKNINFDDDDIEESVAEDVLLDDEDDINGN